MDKIEWIAPCHFGLESVLKREVEQLGYEIVQVEDGRVTFRGGAEAVCRANIFLRTAERVLMKVGSFQAKTFDELFECTKALPWEVSRRDLAESLPEALRETAQTEYWLRLLTLTDDVDVRTGASLLSDCTELHRPHLLLIF